MRPKRIVTSISAKLNPPFPPWDGKREVLAISFAMQTALTIQAWLFQAVFSPQDRAPGHLPNDKNYRRGYAENEWLREAYISATVIRVEIAPHRKTEGVIAVNVEFRRNGRILFAIPFEISPPFQVSQSGTKIGAELISESDRQRLGRNFHPLLRTIAGHWCERFDPADNPWTGPVRAEYT